jgi:hypothetical protein
MSVTTGCDEATDHQSAAADQAMAEEIAAELLDDSTRRQICRNVNAGGTELFWRSSQADHAETSRLARLPSRTYPPGSHSLAGDPDLLLVGWPCTDRLERAI